MALRVQLKPWLWLLPFIHICCAGKLSLSGIDAETFEQRALAPGIFVMACMLAPSSMLHSQISLTEPPTVCMVCDTIDRGLSFLYANSSAWGSSSLGCTFNTSGVVRLSRQHVDLRTSEPCKALTLELTVAAESLAKTSEVDVYEFDCSEDDGFCASMEVLSFPTIRIFDHREWTRYRGAPKAPSYVPGLATV
jgi:hypothetical protein